MGFFRVIFAFIVFFRPAILHPSFSSLFLILPLVIWQFLKKRGEFWRPLKMLNFGSVALLFVLLWSLTIDIFTGELLTMGFRSKFANAIRFFLYIYFAYAFVFYFTKSRAQLDTAILQAIVVQCILALYMIADRRIKEFFYLKISGYTGQEKLFRDHFFDVRIFGWSEELFFTAPVMMLCAIIILYRAALVKWTMAVLLVFIVAIFNARISVISLILLARSRQGLIFSFLIFFLSVILGSALVSFASGSALTSEILSYILSGLKSGNIRIVQSLYDQIYLPSNISEWILGTGQYLYGGSAKITSDVGYSISLMYGGLIYVIFWMFILTYIIVKSSHSFFTSLFMIILFGVLNFKGLIFSGNAMTMLILILFFRGRAYETNNFNQGRS